jgi:murein DD-endopeptidase MepM/ murein hydrolase activator NlpD
VTGPVDAVPRRGRTAALVIALTAVLVLLCCGGAAPLFFLGGLFDEDNADVFGFGCGSTALVDPGKNLPRAGQLGDEQMRNAAIIIKVGQQMQVPPRGWVIAIATALQESRLINLGNLGASNDHDSLGLFQQRPSQGWGTPQQIMDPVYASQKFYEKLIAVPDWQRLSLTQAAQRVQRSAFPDAYAKHEPLATLVVNMLTDGAARAAGSVVDLRCVLAGEISASGWTAPLRGKIISGFRTAGRPTHQGVDLVASKRTPIHAAAAGTVVRVRCNVGGNSWAPTGGPMPCDVDGSPTTGGCGWYVDILHAGAVVTRYCHMVVRPEVALGQPVAAGQRIGLSGSSGNSSGPHLHFEVHLDGDSSSAGAIDPDRFMRDVGAPLGDGTP